MAWRQNQGALHVPAHFDGIRIRKKRFVRFADVDGISDIMGLIAPDGRTLAVECKVRPNTLTKAQAAFIEKVRRLGGFAIEVVDDVMHLDQQLKAAGY